MNGYISPCFGDTHPPIFRSPVAGMEDILANEVICVIYRLPDAHKHITYPPPGVIFPEKIVQLRDLKPEPVLWHEDSGRRPWESGRHNAPESISGRQLGEASHRLIVNSLQMKVDHNRFGNNIHAPPAYNVAPHVQARWSNSSYGFRNQGHNGMVPPGPDHCDFGTPHSSNAVMRTPYVHGYGQPHSSLAVHSHTASYPQYQRNDRSAGNTGGEYPRPANYLPGSQHNSGPMHLHRPTPQMPSNVIDYPRQGDYVGHQNYESPRTDSYQQLGGMLPPPANQSSSRGYGHHGQQRTVNKSIPRGYDHHHDSNNRQQRGNQHQSGNPRDNQYSVLRHRNK
ncbi:5'-3' exoribonuclease 3 [Carica papaya]|uniref:5'-3' exoribonuclease 3 n=1 Tax=Carica papaya TaxID=3649 RepID=UPI000B8D0176|nr:5'-3' exoribonuclease 3 [Carica papaya]